MIDGSEKRNRQLALELQNSHVCEKRSNTPRLKANYCLRLLLSSINSVSKRDHEKFTSIN